MANNQVPEKKEGKTRDRSPSYPAVGLREAIERVRRLYESDGKAGAPMEAAFRSIGFGGKNGASLKVMAALRKFDLVQYQGGRAVPTKTALDILVFEDSDERKKAAKRAAALSPDIYRELVEAYREAGRLPSDTALKSELIADRGFNRNSVDAFLKDFRDTLELAGLARDGVLALTEGVTPKNNDDDPVTKNDPPSKGNHKVEGERELTTGLLSKNASFRLIVSGEVGVREIERLIAKLQLDKEILADPDGDDSASE